MCGACRESTDRVFDSAKAALKTTPHRTRTCNLRFRRPMLYPIELAALSETAVFGRIAAKGMTESSSKRQASHSQAGNHICHVVYKQVAHSTLRTWQQADNLPTPLPGRACRPTAVMADQHPPHRDVRPRRVHSRQPFELGRRHRQTW